MTIAGILVITVLIYGLYRMYFPVIGVKETNIHSFIHSETCIVDVRQFQLAHNEPVKGSLNMPLAYLTRHFPDIDCNNVYLVVSDKVERNISVRFLKKQGFIIRGYQLIQEKKLSQLETRCAISEVCKET